MVKKNEDKFDVIFDIILDTTNLFTSNLKIDDLNGPVKKIVTFIKDNKLTKNVNIFIPDVVKNERIHQNIKSYKQHKQTILSSLKTISQTGIQINTDELEKFDYETSIKETIEQLFQKYKLNILKTSQINVENLFERYYVSKKPFENTANSEKGFKDTLIWISILEFGKQTKNNVIFVTNNTKKDFDDDVINEFKEYTKKDILIVRESNELTELLDKKLNLKLKLKEYHDKIQNIILKYIGEVILKINKDKDYISINDGTFSVLNRRKYICFDLKDFKGFDIVKETKDIIELNLNLLVIGNYLEPPKEYTSPFDTDELLTTNFGLSSLSSTTNVRDYKNMFTGYYEKGFDAKININLNLKDESIIINKIKLENTYRLF